MKLVLDTNVLIAAFITHGTCNEILEYCALNHEVVISPFILRELQDKLTQKFGYTDPEVKSVAQLLEFRFSRVDPLPLAAPVCRDPDDDPIIATAMAGDCTCIVTGDKDLLDLNMSNGTRMVSPTDFWTLEHG